jgi:hypothetical protein
MPTRRHTPTRSITLLRCAILLLTTPRLHAQSPAATAAFNNYAAAVEFRLAQQHRNPSSFLATNLNDPATANRLRNGELLITELTPTGGAQLPGALLHHWRATAFAPGAAPAAFDRLMRDFNAYPQHFAPEVLTAHTLAQPQPNQLLATMRIRQHHILTVVLDATYAVDFATPDGAHGYTVSRSTRIDEIASPSTPAEHALTPADAHGFLWRQNTYWSYVARDGGLYLELESVSLSRGIPRGLGWAVQPFIESIPRESLEFTLHSAVTALRK